MQTFIQNEFLKATISHKGAELASVWKNDYNYLWDINTQFWDKTSPVLFPIIGGLKENKFVYEGKDYYLPRHGFARESEFNLVSKTEDSAVFSLKFNEESLKNYPFEFELQIGYFLKGSELKVEYKVINLSSKKIYFSVGAHPAFRIDGNFEDYTLEFDSEKSLKTYKLQDNLFSGVTEEIPLENKKLKLNYSIFEKDALVLKESATSSLTLLKNEKPVLKVSFPEFPFLGIWTKKDAPFICIEPWLGIADSHNATGKLEEKEGIQPLDANSEFSASWTVEFF